MSEMIKYEWKKIWKSRFLFIKSFKIVKEKCYMMHKKKEGKGLTRKYKENIIIM